MITATFIRFRRGEPFAHRVRRNPLRAMPALLLVAFSGVLFASEALLVLAERGRDKIDGIIMLGEEGRSPGSTETITRLTEAEINAVLNVYGPELLTEGIASPEIRLGTDGRIRARATIDLSAVRSSRPRAWHDPLAYITGSVEVVATGRVVAQDGVGRVLLETTTVGGVSVPQGVAHELIRYYTTTPDDPGGFDIDTPFELPHSIRHVLVEQGHAIVVQ